MDPFTLVIILTLATGEERSQHYRMGSLDTCQQFAIAARRRAHQKGQNAKVECRPEFNSDRLLIQSPSASL